MRTIRSAVILAAAMLVIAAPGCDFTPTAVHHEAAGTALFSSNGQARVDLCHRTSRGDYTKITVADAAYDTHLAHGDVSASAWGQCPAPGAPRFDVTFDLEPADDWPDLVIVIYGPSGTSYEYCEAQRTCAYGLPLGSIVLLASTSYTYAWSDPACAGSISCVLNDDLSVLVTAAVEEENPY